MCELFFDKLNYTLKLVNYMMFMSRIKDSISDRI